ncbi:hypothetical protein K439DRAFT_946265 [Ramaria rubella]|nr:hypothetical protein K439DRAFT_946265 [Ramaria rubella]
MPGKNKDRLYLALNHRHEKPGYHWAILLAPKDSKEESLDQDSTCWDITNGESNPNWRYREGKVNQLLCISLCARILLGKFEENNREVILELLREKLKSVEIIQQDASFTCRVWALNAIQALESSGIIRLKIHHGKLDIASKGAIAIPVMDLRK